MTPEGTVSTLVPAGVVTQPFDVDISHKGELVVTDAYQGVLHVFDLSLLRPDHIKVPRSSYTSRMVDLLETGEAADVVFVVRAGDFRHGACQAGAWCLHVCEALIATVVHMLRPQVCGEHVPAHRLILTTQSDYFKKMLGSDFAEGHTATVQVRMRGRAQPTCAQSSSPKTLDAPAVRAAGACHAGA